MSQLNSLCSPYNTFFHRTTPIIFFSSHESPQLLFTVRQLQLTGHCAIASVLLASHRATAFALHASHRALVGNVGQMVDNAGEVQKANNEVQEISDEVQQFSSEEEVSESKKRKIKLRSFVWKHFSKLPGGHRAKCHYCGKSYAAHSNSGTSVTAHFIDEEWVLHKRILTFTPISNHKGDAIGKLIENCLIDWGIEKLFTITVDNASANTLAISYMKKKLANWSGNSMVLNGLYMHVRCSAHIINLIVQDGLSQVNQSIASIRNAVKYVRSSPTRLQKFKTYVDMEKISRGGLMVLDMLTRWNSTYLMLEKMLAFEKAFDRLKEDDGHYTNWFDEDESEKKEVGPPTNEDWENSKRLVKCLSVFYYVTLKFSSSLTVTFNNYLNEMWKVYIHLKSLVDSNDFLLNQMGYKMEEKFVKYWGHSFKKVNMLLIMANVLDPRCKLDFVIWCFSSLYDIRKVDELRVNIKELLLKLFGSYGGESNPNRGERSSDVHDSASSSHGSFDAFTQFRKMKESSNDDIIGKKRC
ncbi:BED-type domain-containing protein [Citrus sinensis]|uniref:BED-type domain-containing protein n=1 Tax=Citrus sinensis TaxID=2711 RepID=A0ACB8M4S6_CITSI|nr:BED-type domain-containing protein [Citrus sinensis]